MADQDGPQAVGQPGGRGSENDEVVDQVDDADHVDHVGPVGPPETWRPGGPGGFIEGWRMPRAPWWRRPRAVGILGAGLVVLLVVGLLAWRNAGSGGGNRAAFEAAIDDLAAAPAAHYTSRPSDGGGMEWDLRITADGSGLGTVSLGGLAFDVLTVGGQTYVKASAGTFDALGLDLPEGVVLDRWITGGTLVDTALPPAMSPGSLADGLRRALRQTDDISGEGLAEEVGGRPAQGARTPRGDLYISRDRPYEVLRFVPRWSSGGPAGSRPSVPEMPSLPSIPPGPSMPGSSAPAPGGAFHGWQDGSVQAQPPASDTAGPAVSLPGGGEAPGAPEAGGQGGQDGERGGADLPGLGEIDVDAVPPGDPSTLDDLTGLYDQLTAATEQLETAVDARHRFSVQGAANVSCFGGCVVTATVTNTLASSAGVAPNALVSAEMFASLNVDGAPAGSCTSPPTPLPVNGSGPLSCTSLEAGGRAASVLAQKQAQAAGLGGFVTVSVTGTAQVVARATGTVQVAEMTRGLGEARARALGDACGVRRGGGGRRGFAAERASRAHPAARGTGSDARSAGLAAATATGPASAAAQAADPCRDFVPLTDVVPDGDVRWFRRQSQSTYAAVYAGRRRVGDLHRSRGQPPRAHAEEQLDASGDIDDALADAARRAGRGEDAVVDVVMNRTPCNVQACVSVLVDAARRAAERGVRLRVVVTGAYTGGQDPDAATTVGWITAMLDQGAEVVVGVPPGGTRPGGAALGQALGNVHASRG